MRFIASLIVAFASLAALPAAAQELPGRVGRIAYIDGSAAIYQEPEEGWERAYVNSPITSENSVWTDPGSRAELRVGGTAVRLNEATQVDIARLDDEALDAFIARGVVAVRVRHYDRGERLVFNTPHARFVIRANGRYRIDVDPDQEESRITVFAGEARVGSEGGRVRAIAGQTVRVFGGSQSSYVVERAYADPFDRWAQTRDATWVETRSVKYVSPYMTGYEDLDRYGEWREESDFGALWFPTRIASDWAPYRYGRWDYVRPWGWTWVDDAPWGYAPFHYGRWVFVRDRWAWSPGRREVRPAWAPALVAWIGGSNFSVGVSSGPSVGWYPLSPWDRYQPWYNASTTYVNRINVTVLDRPQRDDRRQWMERTRDRGVTVVNRDAVVERRPVQQARVQVNPEVVRQAQAATVTAAQVLPSRNEVIQRRQTARTQAAASTASPVKQPGPAPAPTAAAAQRGERAAPAARPDFARKPAAAAAAPEPAKTAPPPPKPVTAPTTAAQQQAREEKARVREQAEKGRDTRAADQQKAREEQLKQREAQQQQQQQQQEQQKQEKAARGEQQRQQQQGQERAQQERERALQEKAAREAQQNQQRQQQQQGQERAQQERERALQEKAAREAQQNQQRQQQQQGQERAQQEKAAREAQQLQQRQQQQQAQERAQQEKAAREAQQLQQRQQQQQAQERALQEKAAAQAQQRQQAQQAQERAQQEKAAREAQQAQQRQQRAQPQPQQQQQQPPPPPAQSAKERARQEREKAKAEKDEEEKKGKGR